VKHLLITADDFGRSPAVNAATERLHRAGLVTRASLLVHEPHAAEAVEIARRHPPLCVGLHLDLCGDAPARAGWRLFFQRKNHAAIAAEIRAQFERFLSFGLPPTYWDGHAHLHLHPTVLRLTLPIARELGFRSTRLVREPGPPALLPWIFQRLSAHAAPRLAAHGIGFTDHVFGLRDTGRMTTSAFARLLENLPEGTSEIYFHPGAEPEELDLARLTPLRSTTTPRPAL
jgi:predicted glycoside hydrolase/deacetylase ChbG (UPF0249 family)